MAKFYLIGFAVLLLFDTAGQLSFKLTAIAAEPLEFNHQWLMRIFTNHWVYVAIFAYVGTFFTWMTLLKRAPIGPAFAAAHMEVITVMLVSMWLLNEQLSWLRLLGAALIVAGIICLAFAEKRILRQN